MTSSPNLRRAAAGIGAAAVLAAGAGIADAALDRSDGPKPPAASLPVAVAKALGAPKPAGLTAHVRLTNHLLPAGTLPRGAASPLASGATGTVHMSGDGRLRADLRVAGHKAQVVADGRRLRIYDATTNTEYRLASPVPAGGRPGPAALPGFQQQLGQLLRTFSLSDPKPTTTAGRASYTVRISPRDDGGLLGAAELAWDAKTGIPLRAAVHAQGQDDPVLELEVTDIDYGAVDAADVAPAAHPGAKVVDLGGTGAGGGAGPGAVAPATIGRVHGAAAVGRRLGFQLAAPETLAGLRRGRVQLARLGSQAGAVSVYGGGLGRIVVLQFPAAGSATDPAPADAKLPEINIDGRTGRELATPLGTILTFTRDGVRYVIGGSVPPIAAENAARDLR